MYRNTQRFLQSTERNGVYCLVSQNHTSSVCSGSRYRFVHKMKYTLQLINNSTASSSVGSKLIRRVSHTPKAYAGRVPTILGFFSNLMKTLRYTRPWPIVVSVPTWMSQCDGFHGNKRVSIQCKCTRYDNGILFIFRNQTKVDIGVGLVRCRRLTVVATQVRSTQERVVVD